MKTESISRIFLSHFPADAEGFRSSTWRGAPPGGRIVPLYPSLVHALQHAGELDASVGITLVHENGRDEAHRSYKQIASDVAKLAAHLRVQGVQAGDRVALVLHTSFEFVLCFFAVQWVGAIPVPTFPPTRFGRLEAALTKFEHIVRNAGAKFFIVSGPNANLLGELPERIPDVRMLLAEHILADSAAAVPTPPISMPKMGVDLGELVHDRPEARWNPTSPAFIQYTSGSTGQPKGAIIEHRHALSNVHAIGQASHITRSDVVVSWLPLHHDMGLIGAMLFAVYWCIPLVLLTPTTFLANPFAWLSAIHRHKGTLSPAPNFAFAHCVARVKPQDVTKLDLSTWRLAFNGAEPVNFDTVELFEKTFGPVGFKSEAMLPVYGLAEATLAVSFWRSGVAPKAESVDREALASGRVEPRTGPGSTKITCVGSAVPGHEVVVCDESGRAIPDGEVGHILVRGPSVMRGYWGNEAETKVRLRDGWLWTGDLGYKRGDEMYVTGRTTDLIIVRGKNYYAEDLESIAEKVKGVRGSGCVAFGVYDETKSRDTVVMVCETRVSGRDELLGLEDAVRTAVAEEAGLAPDFVVLVPPGTIPRTSSGKRQRQRLKGRFVRGDLRSMSATGGEEEAQGEA